jgi:hypothetical protein
MVVVVYFLKTEWKGYTILTSYRGPRLYKRYAPCEVVVGFKARNSLWTQRTWQHFFSFSVTGHFRLRVLPKWIFSRDGSIPSMGDRPITTPLIHPAWAPFNFVHDLNLVATGKNPLPLLGIESRSPGRLVCSQTLHWLSCFSCARPKWIFGRVFHGEIVCEKHVPHVLLTIFANGRRRKLRCYDVP